MESFTPFLIAAAVVTVFGVFLSLIRLEPKCGPAAEAERGIAELETYLREVSRD